MNTKDEKYIENHTKFLNACYLGNLNNVKFYLTDINMRNQIDIDYLNGSALKNAFSGGHLHIIKYLTTSPELKKTINIVGVRDECAISACSSNKLEALKYLLSLPSIQKIGMDYNLIFIESSVKPRSSERGCKDDKPSA